MNRSWFRRNLKRIIAVAVALLAIAAVGAYLLIRHFVLDNPAAPPPLGLTPRGSTLVLLCGLRPGRTGLLTKFSPGLRQDQPLEQLTAPC